MEKLKKTKIKLIIISNRKLCKDKKLEEQLEKIFSAYKRKEILKNFEIIGFTLREKDLSNEDYLKLLEKIYPICEKYKIKLIIHEKYDLFLENKYHIEGLHLSFDTFKSMGENKNFVTNFIKRYKNIGVSVHSINEAKEAEALGVTYLIAGHIFMTTCKKDLEARGLEFLKELSFNINIPIFAIGGINENNSDLVVENGSYGVCMMSSLMEYK